MLTLSLQIFSSCQTNPSHFFIAAWCSLPASFTCPGDVVGSSALLAKLVSAVA